MKSGARAVLPKEWEYELGITPKPKAMTFPVGAGMTPEQTKTAYKKIEQVAKTAPTEKTNFFKEVVQSTARSIGSATITAATPFLGTKTIKSEELRPIERAVKEFIFGKEDIKSLQQRIAESEIKTKEFAEKYNLPIIEKGAIPLSFIGVGLMTALDFTGFGGEDDLIKILAKSTDEKFIAKILKQINVADDLIPDVAKTMATISDKKVIKEALDKIVELQKITKVAEETIPIAQKGIKEAISTEKGFNWIERGFIASVKEELPQLKVAGQYVPRSTDRLAIKAVNLIKSDIQLAEKVALKGTNDASIATAAELIKHYGDEALKATDNAVRDVFYDKAAYLANTTARKLTEQGRSVQAASILGRLTPEGQLRFAAREIQKYNEEIKTLGGGMFGLKKKIPELTKEQAKIIQNEMVAIKSMKEGTEKAMRFQKLQNYITDLVPTPLMKKIITVWKAGLLTGLKTSGVNIFANISHFGAEVVKDIPATIVDRVISLLTGKRSVVFNIKGIREGVIEGGGKGWRYLTTGFDERNIGTKLDYTRINFGKGKLAQGLQAYTDTIFRIMGTEDQPFYYAAKLRSLYEQAKVEAINKGLKGQEAQKFIDDLIQNPTEQMIKYATTDAETMVFQNKTALGTAARSIQKLGGGGGEIVVPFSRTPSAVAMQVFNYSPAGAIKTLFENIGKGRFDQRLFSQGIGRSLTGTGVLALGVLLYKKGLLTTARPSGETEQKLWELEGKQPNSIKIGNKWRQVQVLGPLGNILLIGGSFQKAFDNSGSPSEAMAQGLANSSQSFTQQTFLTGVSNFIDAISDPTRSAKSIAGSTLASTIPTIVSDIARATDTKERRANEIFEKFQARIPGIRETLEPQVTVLGEEKARIGNPLEIMIDPTRPSPAKSTPIIEELRRLWDKGYKVSPTLLGDKKGYSSLTSEQNTKLWKRAGEIISEKLSNLIKSEEYNKMSDEKKSKTIDNFVDKAKIVARAEMVLELTNGLKGDEFKNKMSELKKSGLMKLDVYNKYLELR